MFQNIYFFKTLNENVIIMTGTWIFFISANFGNSEVPTAGEEVAGELRTPMLSGFEEQEHRSEPDAYAYRERKRDKNTIIRVEED